MASLPDYLQTTEQPQNEPLAHYIMMEDIIEAPFMVPVMMDQSFVPNQQMFENQNMIQSLINQQDQTFEMNSSYGIDPSQALPQNGYYSNNNFYQQTNMYTYNEPQMNFVFYQQQDMNNNPNMVLDQQQV